MTQTNSWALHMTLYRVCCIEYTWLFVNAQFYAVLCISHLNNLKPRKPTLLLKNVWNICMCISVSDFYMKIINNKHTLLYNRPTIHSVQRYPRLRELTKYVNVLNVHHTSQSTSEIIKHSSNKILYTHTIM